MTTMSIPFESRKSRLAQLLPGVYYVLERTDRWEVRKVTEQTVLLFGYEPDEVISMARSFLEMIIYSEDVWQVQAFKRDSTDENRLYEIEFRVRTKGGEIRNVLDRYTCYRDEFGRLIMEGYICEVAHLTQRDKVFHQLQAYRNAVDVSMISSITDRTGKIIYANDNFCAVSKYEMSELIGQNHRIVNSGTHSREFFNELWSTISSGKLWHGEIRNRAKDGSLYWVDTVIIPIFDDGRKIASYLSLRTLIDDRKNAEERKKTYTDMLEKLAFMVAHDVRGPLCSIMGLADVLLNYTNSSNELKRGLEYMADAATQLDKITHQLTKFVNEHEFELKPNDPIRDNKQ